MKRLITNTKWRWSTSLVVVALFTIGAFFLTNVSPARTSILPVAPIYVTGNFAFSAPLNLTLTSNQGTFSAFDAEPEIKIDIFGNIYVTAIQGVPAGTDFWKSIDKGASFVYLGQPDGAQDHCQTLPQCVAGGGGDDSIAVSNGGYLYVSSLWLGSVTMSASYDGGTGGVANGQKWEVNPAAATIPGDDRQWIAAYGPQTVYMSYTDIPTGGIDFEKSTDGGKTFSAPVPTYNPVTSAVFSDVQGNMVADQYNGNIYICFIPIGASNKIYLEKSTDGGATWTLIQAYNGPVGTSNVQVFPSMAVDRGGNVHIAFSSCSVSGTIHTNCQIQLISSTNEGATFTPAIRVSNGPDTATAVEPTAAAGSPGVVNITWLGSAASSPDVASNWHVFFAQTQNALSTSPLFAQNQVEAAVMHQWDICFNGLGCANNAHQSPGNRDLLEYYSMVIDNDGNANIVYPNSVTNCPTGTCITNTWYAKQIAGPSAYKPPAGPVPATFATNLTMPMSGGTAEPNAWADSYNCIYGGSIGGPRDFISTDAGLNFTEHSVVVGTGVHGGDFDLFTIPKADGTRPDLIYTADLGITSVHIGKSTDRGNTYFQPGTGGSAGEVSVSSDRMWLAGERGVPTAPDQTIYLMDHEFTTEAIRFSASTNDMAWSGFNSGMTDLELILPPSSTLPNTNPGPDFVNKVNHNIYGIFGASTLTTNTLEPPFGKEPNVWIAMGPAPITAGAPPGPFTNHPVFKGPIDSPTNPAPPAGTTTYGSHMAAIFPSGDADASGNVYAVWALNSARPNAVQTGGAPTHTYDIWFAASHDFGATFYGPWRVSSGVGTSVFPWISAGDNGRVDVAWYQSSDVAPPILSDPSSPGQLTGGPNNMPAGSTWNVMFAQSLNANTREPVFTVSQASDHIIHSGSISIGGLTGSSDRSLLDFFELKVGPDGLANIMFADNGVSSLKISYARQNGGQLALVNPSSVTCLPPPPQPIGIVSTKFHGTNPNPFPVDLFPPAPGIECRKNTGADTSGPNQGRDHRVVVTFPAPVTLGSVTVSTNNPIDPAATATFSGSGTAAITIDLHNIPDQRRLTITLNGVTDNMGKGPGPVLVKMGVLLGDTTNDGTVSGADITQTKREAGNVTIASNAREDVTLDGSVSGADVTVVKRNAGHQFIPASP
jgi:hypothetical protein